MSCQTHRSAHEGGYSFHPQVAGLTSPPWEWGQRSWRLCPTSLYKRLSLSNHLGFGFEYGRSLKPARTTRNTCCEFMLYKAIFG